MNKKMIFRISVCLNVILAIVFMIAMIHAIKQIDRNWENNKTWAFVDILIEDKLKQEEYGWMGAQTRPWRYGAKGNEDNREYYELGEYTDLLFFREIYQAAGELSKAGACEERLKELKVELDGQSGILNKMEQSVEKAQKE